MDPPANSLHITHVEKEGPFLKVWGQTDIATALYIDQVLSSLAAQFDGGLCVPRPETLQTGILCCVKYKDGKYHRVRLSSLNFLHNRYVEVDFVDHGYRDVVPLVNVRSLEGFESSFIAIPAQAFSFLLAEAVSPQGDWNDAFLEEIAKETRGQDASVSVVAQAAKFYLARLFVHGSDLALLLIARGLMRQTSLMTQEAVLLSMIPRAPPGAAAVSVATFKAFTLEAGSQYEVYVSYVTDGPCNFSVQLKNFEEVLCKLMKEINSMTLTPVEAIPLPGTVCLAKCLEDGHICRAVVTNRVDGHLKVFYVDFGNFETVPLDALYEIPFKYVIPKAMAIPFALNGVDKSTVTLEMQCAFKQFVDNRLILMKVMPNTSRTALSRCELWDPTSHISALEIVLKAAAAYPEPAALSRGFSQTVKISYVFSCNRFYVQLKAKEDDLLRLMADIQGACAEAAPLPPEAPKVGLPCCALFEVDQQWYRSQIAEIVDANLIKVHYVDYGNEEVLALTALKPIDGKQLTVLRPQAIECCLNGYQNMEPDLERDNLLEELILEQEFTMKVVEMQGKKALVELIDPANYNVASLLLDKIAVTRSQVSPMLVQAGNKIEHRKSQQQFKSPVARNKSFESEETNDNQWRQTKDTFDNKRNDDVVAETFDAPQKGYNKHNGGADHSRGFNKNDKSSDWGDSSFSPKEDANKPWGDDGGNKGRDNNWSSDNANKKPFNKGEWKPRENFGGGGDRKPWDNNDNRGRKPYNRDNNDSEWKGGDDNRGRKPYNRDNDSEWKSNDDNRGRKPYNRDNNDSEWKGGDDNRARKPYSRDGDSNWKGSDDNRARKPYNRETNDSDWKSNDKKRDNDADWKGHDDRGPRKPYNRETTEWNPEGKTDDSRTFRKPYNKDDTFKKPRDRFNGDGDTWNSDSKPTFRKNDFNRERSDLSDRSGSEKSFKKTYKDKTFTKKPSADVPNPAPPTAQFATLNLDQSEATINISWFHSPAHFFCLLEDTQTEFKAMMSEIQEAYKNRQPSSAVIGAPIIGLFPEDNVLYRAQVLECTGAQFKVLYVDFGNISTVSKVWPIETRFMALPAQAVSCQLAGAAPSGEQWAESGTFGKYFDKSRYLCKFIAKQEDKYNVKLECDGEDVGEQLVRDGLALAQFTAPPIEIAFLIGQQFRAMLLSVNSLADFVVCLQGGAVLSCAAFNLAISTETFEGNLREKIDQIVILYVDDLAEDKIAVTLYDSDGVKIKLVDRDEEAYETVELLCPYLVSAATLGGDVTHVDGTTVFIQPLDCADNVAFLLNSMYEVYEASTVEAAIVPVEGYVYAVRGSDLNWYRGRVTTFDDASVTVLFIDYGNSESLELGALRELNREFMNIWILCVPIIISAASDDLLEQRISVAIQFTEAGLEGTILGNTVSEPSCTLEPTPICTEQPLHTEEPAPVGTEELAPELAAPEAPPVHGTLVALSHTDSPTDFYLQLTESLTSIEHLQATLQSTIDSMPDLETTTTGVLCAAPFSLDQQWYRAQVLDFDADITTVRFIDYGNTDVINNATTKIKTLPADLLTIETHATRCRLMIKPLAEEWGSVETQRFEELCGVEMLTVQFHQQDERTNHVELHAEGVSVADVMVQEGHAHYDDVTPASTNRVLGYVSHQNSPSEFWIQLENCIDELESVAEQLSSAEAFAELEELAPGTLCAALFPDDQMWYRARILSNTVAGIEVVFVDYGNSCVSCSLRELPEEVAVVAPLAQKCSLLKPEGLYVWGPAMVRRFAEISAEGQTTFELRKLTDGETAVVELLLEGADVAGLLVPPIEEVGVKRCARLDEMVLVKGGVELEGRFKLEDLADQVWNDESVKRFNEIALDGATIFQAEFVSDDIVRLYIGLNDIRLDLGASKTTTPQSSPLKCKKDLTPSDMTSLVNEMVGNSIETHNESVLAPIVNDLIDGGSAENDLGSTPLEEAENEGTDGVAEESTTTFVAEESSEIATESTPVATFDQTSTITEESTAIPESSDLSVDESSAVADDSTTFSVATESTTTTITEDSSHVTDGSSTKFIAAESTTTSTTEESTTTSIAVQSTNDLIAEESTNALVAGDATAAPIADESANEVTEGVAISAESANGSDALPECDAQCDKGDKNSRPGSSASGPLGHDEKVVAAVWSRPQTPVLDESTNEKAAPQ